MSLLIDTLQRMGLHPTHSRMQIKQRLAKAGIYRPTAPLRFLLARICLLVIAATLMVAAGIGGLLRLDLALLFSFIAGGFGALLPSIWLDRAIKHHHVLLRKSLPDFLDLMIICLEGGLSLQETIRRVSDELLLAHPIFAAELDTVQRDIELGATVDQALKRFASRSDYDGLRTLSAFIREAQRFGTNITEALRSHADMVRCQREQAAEENAQKVAVKILLPTLFLIFPAIFVVAVGPAIIQIHEAFASTQK
jgi:tight adherence protein C